MSCNAHLAVLFPFLLVPTLLSASSQPLREGWQVQSACSVKEDGTVVSQTGFGGKGWMAATVPATVVAAQVASGELPDPYFSTNLRKLPGMDYPVGKNFSNLPMPETSPYRCGWWYRRKFQATRNPAQRTSLHFGGINYRGELWVNGRRVAGKDEIAGAYRTYDFDVTDALTPDGQNVVAVEVFAPTEKDLGINWVDWNPCPPDKDMGLWGAVDLQTTGTVTLRAPVAVTHFTSDSLASADLTIYAELHNAGARSVQATVHGAAAGVHFQQNVMLAPGESRTVRFDPADFRVLHIVSPRPWWPAQMGEPHLETLSMRVTVSGVQTDAAETRFGFREMSSELTANGSRLFRVNGKPILVRGGGWSQDMLLRANDERLREEFRMVRDLNLNTIRPEGKLETESFFRMADEQGVLVMLGWCCCDHWGQWASWTPEDKKIAAASLHDQLLRVRQHASLLVWLNGSDNAPPDDVERMYLDVEAATHWPNPVLSSAAATNTPGGGPSGVKMTGPYDYVEPSYWSVDRRYGGAYGFNTETSPGPAIPSLASRRRFLSEPEAWPATEEWTLHYGGGEFGNVRAFDDAMAAIYSRPANAAEYERMAQTMAYDAERAMFEAYSRNEYTATGVVQWMLNNAWPSMIWHLYDYNLDPGAGYFGAKKACEPLHLAYTYDDSSIVAVNSTYGRVAGLHASVGVHNPAWKELFHLERELDLAPDSVQQLGAVPAALFSGAERIFFIELVLSDATGKELSRNVYWVPGTLTTFDWLRTDYTRTPAQRYEDLSALTHLPPASLKAHARERTGAEGRQLAVELKNPSSTVAFQVSAAVRASGGDLVAPVLWSDNWVEIAPGGSVVLTATLPANAAPDAVVHVAGWNVAAVDVHTEMR